MDRARGGVFSGAMLLAGLSATLLSGLIAIGIRQVTMTASRPVQVTVQHASGEVAVPEAPPSVSPSAASGVAEPSLARAHTYRPIGVVPRAGATRSSGTTARKTTGSATGGGSVAAPARTPAPSSTSPHATGHTKGNGKGAAKGAAKGAGNGPTHGPTKSKGNGHHH